MPKANRDYWEPKLRRNVERDRETDTRLDEAGWTVIRVWEHETIRDAIARVEAVVGCHDHEDAVQKDT